MKTIHSKMIRNVWAVGRNYKDHAIEMKADIPTQPFFFLKSGSCIQTSTNIELPAWSQDVHHEIELALWFDESLDFSHISLALDLTARDAQTEAKKKSLPWTQAKSFKDSCPMGPWLSLEEFPALKAVLNATAEQKSGIQFKLLKNKNLSQQGTPENMIFNPMRLKKDLLQYFPVEPHDVLLTGTPAGVGPLKTGDTLQAELSFEGQVLLTCHWDLV